MPRPHLPMTEAKNEVLTYQFDETDFKKNRDRFGQHLVGMGLAQRKSDACTYVINPKESLGTPKLLASLSTCSACMASLSATGP
jgi:hypothetical protein